jgi:transcriptional regulator GlxA family with amidase domain
MRKGGGGTMDGYDKSRAKPVIAPAAQVEIALACDAGTANGGLYGLTDLFTYASEFAAKRQGGAAQPPLRIAHWRAEEDGSAVRCAYDSWPGAPHAPSVVVVPNNHDAITEPDRDSPFVPWLRLKHAEGVVIAAVCGGVFLLAKTGLLAGRQATTHWAFSDQFSAQFPDVLMESDQMVIDYGDVLTAGGALAWADLGLRLIDRLLGPAVMLDTARYMNVDPPGREQRLYSDFQPRTKHGDRAVLKAQLWLSAQRERQVSLSEIAQQAGLEPRTLQRRFVQATGLKPSEYQQRLRMTRARELLEFSRTSIDQIAMAVGYEDVGGFRRIFRKTIGSTPSDYRRRFCRLASDSG